MGEVFEIYEGDKEVDRFEVRDLRVKTRFAIDNVFYDTFVPLLGPTRSMIYIAFVRHANKEQKSWPSQKRIAAQIGVTREWVNKQIQVLEFFSLIKKVRVGKSCTNRYYLVDEKYWRTDFENLLEETSTIIKGYKKNLSKNKSKKVMLTEFTSLMRSPVHIDVVSSAHQCLVEHTSNSKDKHSNDTQRKKKISVKKASSTLKKKQIAEEVHVGEGKNVRTYFDQTRNRIVFEHY